jgi:hypothetical protein
MLVNDAFWMGLGSGAARIIYTNTTTDTITFSTANVRIGNGSPGVATAAESLYVEGNIETDGSFAMANGVTVTNILTTLTSNDVSLATGAAILKYGTANWASAGGGAWEVVDTYTAAAVQTALNTVGDNGTIVCTPGVYVFTDAGVSTTGAGTNITIIGYGAIWDASAGQATVPLTIDSDHITVKGLTIRGAPAGGDNTIDLVYVNIADNVTLRDCRLVGSDDDGVEVVGDSDDFTMERCVVDDADDDGVNISSATADDARLISVSSINNGDNGFTLSCANGIMTGCDAKGNTDIGVYLAGAGSQMNGGEISGNSDEGMFLSSRTSVSGVLFDGNTDHALLISGAENVRATSLTFLNTANNVADIKVNASDHITIGDINSKSSVGEWCVWVDASDYVALDNIVSEAKATAEIQIDSDSDNCTIGTTGFDPGVVGITDNSTTTHYGVEAQDDGLLYKGDEILEIQGKVSVLNNASTTWSPTAAQCYGALWVNNATAATDVTLPSAVAGMSFTIVNSTNAVAITVDAAAGDSIILNNGDKTDAADSAVSSGAVDDKGTFVAIDADTWMLISEQNAWSDGGP